MEPSQIDQPGFIGPGHFAGRTQKHHAKRLGKEYVLGRPVAKHSFGKESQKEIMPED